ncbi:MerR-like DNA binding protein [Antricoccus suffuscus]|uniref:MerR-like DNA binding protein n=1 Tax=Antricoccus suffuscus TaxID=1629062 RepID=A0A2T0ZWT7_9ACTN|nr:MerR family transcriptional regulator [Antricoccus suffuscus]PRZ40810.1 MerR-like DNA binding protein [Antricoccus suffuscus]
MSVRDNAAASLSNSETISIGELRAALLPDFPDITISKIRYLEDAGLIQPARTASSYRKFSHGDLARVRYVLTQQRDHYLPLKVIKENLDAIDRGFEAPSDAGKPRVPVLAMARDRDGLPSAEEFGRAQPQLRLSRAELLEASDLTEELLESMEQYGVLAPQRNGSYDADALEVAKAVAQMAEFGIEARHLRPFRTAAEREVGLFAQVVTPMMRHRTPEARGKAEETISELAALSVRLHAALVRSGLRSQLNS